jgi:hypothetical protein
MESNEVFRNQLFEIIKSQMNDNQPPETRLTYDRLISAGYSEFETKQLISQCVAVDIFDVIKNSKPFNENRYIRNLKKLPATPV